MTAPQSPVADEGDCVLAIMAKAPRAGAVKTRLLGSLDATAATALYRCLLEDTVSLARSLPGIAVTIMSPRGDVDELERLAGQGIRVLAQEGTGLAAALRSVFLRANARTSRTIAFNSDSPHVPAEALMRAFDLLAEHDVVVGPTSDGGYYLVGAKGHHPGLFASHALGCSTALEQLMGRARALGLSVACCDRFYDVDVADDVLRLSAELERNPSRAPLTARWLRQARDALSRMGLNP